MPTDVIMPQMGESIFEGTITKWLKQPGDQVQRDEPLFEISTDKVDAEIPAPAAGILKEIKAQAGQTVQVNTVVAIIDAAGSATTSAPKPAAAAPPKSAPQPDGVSSSAPSTSAPSVPAAGPKTDVVMPQMGESIFEGTITKWLKNVGDTVQRDEPLFEISTDKVDAEIPAPVAGVLSEIKVQAGATVQVNTVVATIGGAAGASARAPQAAAPAPSAPAPAAPAPQAPAAAEPEEEEISASGDRVRTSPLVRKMAKEANVDLGKVRGTGMGGRITKEDIQAFVEKQKTAPTPTPQPQAAQPSAPAPAPSAPVAATPNKFAGTPGAIEPMSVMRKKIADHMVMSKRTSAHVHGVFEVDFTKIVKLREKNKNSFQEKTGLKLTYTPFYARAVAHALRAWPIINASVEGENIHYKKDINLGIAVALDWGLIVPVVKQADGLSFVGLQRAITDLGERARAKKLKPEDVQGGTFTITNPGIFGAKFGMPIISQPQLAILGIGAITKVPMVVTDKDGNDSIAIRSRCHISIGYDHRVIDGAVADQFMVVVRDYLQNWNEPLI
ncbi:2-oxoglutarate dehydrogenase E2 component [Candidatus Koribacter versatilis Ellin345]|uniref:Dihydrolipoamide acetyltransferase component of pyruvate dehydrogenase complex n=1 Tax=Koribacter versatilis (strain Ellin345) TaxID=204669 RepID=Q1IIF0_KORVE|nr:2-oxoglutarate dehydrogenase, E2 component, dihydrolipoamide succinyltransferase [Candidatus Koribacter versatilis]ABF43350.1 2-oxoglutarate dehydrogenase E2 component [Candidatus Koribacter versatilis Ellin345]